jgi:hypothetical protein
MEPLRLVEEVEGLGTVAPARKMIGVIPKDNKLRRSDL